MFCKNTFIGLELNMMCKECAIDAFHVDKLNLRSYHMVYILTKMYLRNHG
jgi:hypothetical protein